jgi:hypothetical protein
MCPDLAGYGQAGADGPLLGRTDQESRSAGHRAATSLTSMNIIIHTGLI